VAPQSPKAQTVEPVKQAEPERVDSKPQSTHQVPVPAPIPATKSGPLPKKPVPKKVEWEKPLINYTNNYGPSNIYTDFRYNNLNYEQICELRKRRFIYEQQNQ